MEARVRNPALRHDGEPGLAALLLAITGSSVWHRLNIATRQVADAMPRWD